jgi:hypothetical protein
VVPTLIAQKWFMPAYRLGGAVEAETLEPVAVRDR